MTQFVFSPLSLKTTLYFLETLPWSGVVWRYSFPVCNLPFHFVSWGLLYSKSSFWWCTVSRSTSWVVFSMSWTDSEQCLMERLYPTLTCFCTFAKLIGHICGIYFWTRCSVLPIYASPPSQIPDFLHYCSS